jgi:hypothetical protein
MAARRSYTFDSNLPGSRAANKRNPYGSFIPLQYNRLVLEPRSEFRTTAHVPDGGIGLPSVFDEPERHPGMAGESFGRGRKYWKDE